MGRMPPKTGKCSITGCTNTPTFWHHIISQDRIRRRKDLPLSLLTDPGNLQEFCDPHHKETTSYLVKGYLDKKEARGKKSKWKPKRKARQRCNGFNGKRRRCYVKGRNITEDGFCKHHWYQAPPRHSQYQGDPHAYNPGMNDEGTLSEKQLSLLRDHIYGHDGGHLSERILLSFGYKSQQWRKKWLVEEPKRVPKPSGRIITR